MWGVLVKIELELTKEAQLTVTQLEKQGFVIQKSIDIEIPQLPADITAVDDEALMELFTRLTAYLDFVSTQVSVSQIAERNAEKLLDNEIATSISNQPKGLASVIKANALADQNVMDLSYDHGVKYNYKKLIETMATNIERDMNLVSRELTRRTAGGSTMTRSKKYIT
jgi:hypothetical protein